MNLAPLQAAIRDVPDFPIPGIVFKDITPILAQPDLFRQACQLFVDAFAPQRIEAVVGIEARGFIFGGAVAHLLGTGFIPVRKQGKLPWKTRAAAYALEYGTATLEIHEDALAPRQRVLILDDLLATGGTAAAVAGLVSELGAQVVACAFLIELTFLKGREKLGDYPVFAPLTY
ncbi:MAG: adenine phosphoribosyltransferase [Candidatus Marinimicrobia bacterium]|nr:adenine phosphoribosyltransferase [Candidatus Neomarinimicrobiota bacterium]